MRKSRLSKAKQERLIEYFITGTMARIASIFVGVNKSTGSYYFHRLSELIYKAVEDATPFSGEIEVDESCFGGKRQGKRGGGAAGKVPVFGLLKHGDEVYTKIIPDAQAATLLPIIQERIMPDSIVYTDRKAQYDGRWEEKCGIRLSVMISLWIALYRKRKRLWPEANSRSVALSLPAVK